MTNSPRPRRSVLYMPGSNGRALAKARELPADCLIMDLEDSVAPEAKAAARAEIAAALQAGGYGRRQVVIRVNAPDSPWGADDLAMVARSGAAAVLLPKVETAATVDRALQLLSAAGAPTDLPIWIMAETPRGVLDLDRILTNQPRVAVVVMGTSDLAKALRLPADSGLAHALGQCVLAARAHAVDIIDGVHLALDDETGFRVACQQGRGLGFDGKSLIHPRQIAVANECFGITAAAAKAAREIVAAWQVARNSGHGITVLNGQLIEQLHVDEAERILALHAATNELQG
jgi:citrate lyase subunit beta/citryl-CoA lyase